METSASNPRTLNNRAERNTKQAELVALHAANAVGHTHIFTDSSSALYMIVKRITSPHDLRKRTYKRCRTAF